MQQQPPQQAPPSRINEFDAASSSSLFPTAGGDGGLAPSSTQFKSTLWMGELEPWHDENAIRGIWSSLGEPNVQVKVIRDKFTGAGAGYCFVDFGNAGAARNALYTFNGRIMPNSNNRAMRLNWASGGGLVDKRDDRSPEFSVFVGDLASEVGEEQLLFVFQSRYPSCKSAKIMTDPQTNASRGYGFVRFSDENDMHRSLGEMNGFVLGSRPIRISTATPKNRSYSMPPPFAMYGAASQAQTQSQQPQQQQQQPANLSHHTASMPNVANYNALGGLPSYSANTNGIQFQQQQPYQVQQQNTDPNNTTVFVGGLSPQVSEDELRRYFSTFGDIIYVRIPAGKGCGFVQYVERQSAEAAITQMQGFPLANSRIRLSWGRSQLGANTGSLSTPSMVNGNNNNNPALALYRAQQQQQQLPAMYSSQQPLVDSYSSMTASPFAPVSSHQSFRGHAHSFSQQSVPVPIHSRHRSVASQSHLPSAFDQNGLVPDATEPIPVARLNELYLAAKDGRLDRLDADGRGYHGVYAQ